MRTGPGLPKALSASLLLGILASSPLACIISGSPPASPTPTATSRPTITLAPTATPTFAPIPNPEGLLSYDQRSGYTVILRSSDAAVHERLYAISGYLQERGYVTDIDSLQSDVGDKDIILYGAPSCNDAIDDLTVILEGRLDISGLERSRFGSDDAYFNWTHLVIQIKSISRFDPHL
jgi:hypothetical protein